MTEVSLTEMKPTKTTKTVQKVEKHPRRSSGHGCQGTEKALWQAGQTTLLAGVYHLTRVSRKEKHRKFEEWTSLATVSMKNQDDS